MGGNKMNAFYNEKKITRENLLGMIRECMEAGWENSSLHRRTEEVLEKIYHGYDGVEEDVEYILYKLNSKSVDGGYFYPRPNLQDVETIISTGQWFFQVED